MKDPVTMENNHKNSPMQASVLKAIEAGKVTMRPKWHFVIKTVLFVLGIALLTLAVVYLASFIIFILRESGVLFVPGFGFRGTAIFLRSAPWLLILIAVVCIALLQILVKKYSFAYGKPLIYTALGIIVLVVLGGFLIEMTPIHSGLFQRAEEHRLPFAGEMYLQYGHQRLPLVTPGTIYEINDNMFRIETPREEMVQVLVTPQTKMPYGLVFQIGDHIVVMGERMDDTVTAEGIRPFDDRMPRSGHMPPQMK